MTQQLVSLSSSLQLPRRLLGGRGVVQRAERVPGRHLDQPGEQLRQVRAQRHQPQGRHRLLDRRDGPEQRQELAVDLGYQLDVENDSLRGTELGFPLNCRRTHGLQQLQERRAQWTALPAHELRRRLRLGHQGRRQRQGQRLHLQEAHRPGLSRSCSFY